MEKKLIVLILSGLLVLTLGGCGNSLLGKQASSDTGKVTSDTSLTTNDGTLQEGDQNPNTSDINDIAPTMGRVVSIFDNTVTLLLVTKEEPDGRPETSDRPTADNGAESDHKPSGVTEVPAATEPSDTSSRDNTPVYTTTGETAVLKVTSDTDITLESGEQGKPMDIEVGDILLIQMSGSTTESIIVENKGDIEISDSHDESDTGLPSIKPVPSDEASESNSKNRGKSPDL